LAHRPALAGFDGQRSFLVELKPDTVITAVQPNPKIIDLELKVVTFAVVPRGEIAIGVKRVSQ